MYYFVFAGKLIQVVIDADDKPVQAVVVEEMPRYEMEAIKEAIVEEYGEEGGKALSGVKLW